MPERDLLDLKARLGNERELSLMRRIPCSGLIFR